MINGKNMYRAVKYVWNKDWIGEEAYQKELLCAKQACISDMVQDWTQDQDPTPSEAQIKLTVNHVAKYGMFRVSVVDHCYTKCMLECML